MLGIDGPTWVSRYSFLKKRYRTVLKVSDCDVSS